VRLQEGKYLGQDSSKVIRDTPQRCSCWRLVGAP